MEFTTTYTVSGFLDMGMCASWTKAKINSFIPDDWSGTLPEAMELDVPINAKVWLFVLCGEIPDDVLADFAQQCYDHVFDGDADISRNMPNGWKNRLNIDISEDQEAAMSYSVKAMLRSGDPQAEAEWQLGIIGSILDTLIGDA